MPSIFGIPDSDLQKSEFESMSAALTKWGDDTVDKLLESYDNKKIGKGTPGTLRQSMVVLPINYKNQNWNLSFEAEAYWKFINEGVQGVGADPDTEEGTRKLDWVNKAPNSPFSFKQNNPPSYKHFIEWARVKNLNPFAVRESIFRSGIKATHYYDEVITDDWIKELVKRMEKAGAREIEISLKKDNEKQFSAAIKGI